MMGYSSFFILDTRVNAKTLYCIKNKLNIQEESTFNIIFDLVKRFTYPLIEQCNMNGFCKIVTRKIDYILKE